MEHKTPQRDTARSDRNERFSPLAFTQSLIEPTSSATAPERWMADKFLSVAGNPPLVLDLWGTEEVKPSGETPRYRLHVADRAALYELMSNPNLAFGDLYSEGRLEMEGHMPDLLTDLYYALDRAYDQLPLFLRMIWRNQAPRSTSLKAARDNIHHHYDLGNDFYQLWLDKAQMQYTCAYYEEPDITLEQAQLAKLELVCRKLQLQPGQTVIEAGCGWGGLARYMAKHYGVKVRAFNISQAQVEFARQKAKEEGLENQVEYVLDDYRNITGEYDRFVSVGMLEHVGTDHYPDLADVIRRHMKHDGLALVHSIGRNYPMRTNAWIEKRIFPGAYPPSITEFTSIGEAGPFSVLDVENLRLHYAETLEDWLARYEANIDTVREMYGENFVRAWRLYLAGSIASFRASSLQLFQMVLAHPENNNVPRNRKHLYTSSNVPAEGSY
ncbi:class I SAM-dependent methyltransferase [Halomonadaceae bacterium KBTZ08]